MLNGKYVSSEVLDETLAPVSSHFRRCSQPHGEITLASSELEADSSSGFSKLRIGASLAKRLAIKAMSVAKIPECEAGLE